MFTVPVNAEFKPESLLIPSLMERFRQHSALQQVRGKPFNYFFKSQNHPIDGMAYSLLNL